MSRLLKSLLAAGFMAGLASSALAEPMARVTGYQTVVVGEARVTALYNGFIAQSAGQDQVVHAYKRLTSDAANAPLSSVPDIAAFIVDTGDKVTLVCLSHTEPSPAVQGYLMSSLVSAGYSPDDIDEIRSVDAASPL